jgi:S-DNA-T family DNA segregation ATPase FtsK/SpoIIIE
VAPRASPLSDHPALDRCAATIDGAPCPDSSGPLFVFVDDADRVDGLDALLARPSTHVFAAATADALRTAYGHWTQRARHGRTGVLLRPDLDLDGGLLGVTLPRRPPIGALPGRGYFVYDGRSEMLQCARAESLSIDRGTGHARRRRR